MFAFKVKKTHGVKVWVDLQFAFSNISFDLELLSMNLEQKSFIEVVDGWVVILKLPSPMLTSSELSPSLHRSSAFIGKSLLLQEIKMLRLALWESVYNSENVGEREKSKVYR